MYRWSASAAAASPRPRLALQPVRRRRVRVAIDALDVATSAAAAAAAEAHAGALAAPRGDERAARREQPEDLGEDGGRVGRTAGSRGRHHVELALLEGGERERLRERLHLDEDAGARRALRLLETPRTGAASSTRGLAAAAASRRRHDLEHAASCQQLLLLDEFA